MFKTPPKHITGDGGGDDGDNGNDRNGRGEKSKPADNTFVVDDKDNDDARIGAGMRKLETPADLPALSNQFKEFMANTVKLLATAPPEDINDIDIQLPVEKFPTTFDSDLKEVFGVEAIKRQIVN